MADSENIESMIRVLIVDDERRTREGLLKNVPWEELEMLVTGMAVDGVDALALLPETKPDIVLTDVRMPRMDGIQLARRLREQLPEIEIIFMSGFSDKEYLLSAIDVGALGYVEKPVEMDELLRVVRHTGDVVRSKKLQRVITRRRLLEVLVRPENPAGREAEVHALFPAATWELPCRVFLLRLARNGSTAEMRRQMQKLVEEKAGCWLSGELDGDCVVILSAHSETQSINTILTIAGETVQPGGRFALAAGRTVRKIGDFADSYQDARAGLERAFFDGWNRYFPYRQRAAGGKPTELSGGGTAEATAETAAPAAMATVAAAAAADTAVAAEPEKLFEICMRDDIDGAVHYIDAALSALRTDRRSTGAEAETLCRAFIGSAVRAAKAKNITTDTKNENFDASENGMETLDELHDSTIFTLRQLFECVTDFKSKRRIVFEVERHIRQCTTIVPGMAETAKLFCMSPAYFSRLFRTQTGTTFSEYVALMKMDQAKRLLKDPTIHVNEVAFKIGYDDRRYFSRLFRKYEHLTPTEYRETCL